MILVIISKILSVTEEPVAPAVKFKFSLVLRVNYTSLN